MGDWSDNAIDDLISVLIVFFISAVLIFAILSAVQGLFPSLPLTGSFSGVISIILALFVTLAYSTKRKTNVETAKSKKTKSRTKPKKTKK